MPDSVAKRLQRLQERVDRLAPKRSGELTYMYVGSDVYDEAESILNAAVNTKHSESPSAETLSRPFQQPVEAGPVTQMPGRPGSSETEEFSDRARLKRLRDRSISAESRTPPW